MNEPTLSRLIVDREPEWLRVKNNVSLALMGTMETRLATMPGGKDGDASKLMRKELEGRISKIRDKMFEMSKYNIQVNGQKYEDYLEATEGFDETLDRTIWGLQTERVQWETKMADKRKTLPESIFSVEEDLQMRRTHSEWYPDEEDEKEEEQSLQKQIPPPERHEEVKDTFKTVIDNLAEVAKSAPIQLQRAQRAQTVREEISSLPP
ncbi:uncharacterized protein I206_106020 [Kwoniella pini CBS 10737]|uniref:Uncharacterized protein n=1 Tax=Kwoniella pini CBS 10737 TaxID=1296096 RepID=A0A1B9I0W8_9TREE|nr:uncharacterized protein I206_04843 [Kwoniella pini CBS 10737]OCF49155.1 hypothetical protein I206_04843 [Kwoniella pini CBS 10737]